MSITNQNKNLREALEVAEDFLEAKIETLTTKLETLTNKVVQLTELNKDLTSQVKALNTKEQEAHRRTYRIKADISFLYAIVYLTLCIVSLVSYYSLETPSTLDRVCMIIFTTIYSLLVSLNLYSAVKNIRKSTNK